MFDEHARELIDRLPDLPNLDRSACRRALSAAYFYVVHARLGLENPVGDLVDVSEVRVMLRRMADALESVAVFDRSHGIVPPVAVEDASAFVAAEAIALLLALPSSLPQNSSAEEPETDEVHEPELIPGQGDIDAIQRPKHYLAVEAALLYLISGYEINAIALVDELPDAHESDAQTLRGARQANASYLLGRLRDLCLGRVVQPRMSIPFRGYDEAPKDYETLIEETRLWIYYKLAEAILTFLKWLGGFDGSLSEARRLLEKVRSATITTPSFPTERQTAASGIASRSYNEFADMFHLSSILMVVFERVSQRSLLHSLPIPTSHDPSFANQFETYRVGRARGAGRERGRPFLWPSALEFIHTCLPGPKCDMVVSMPTGSGKSFVAELAIVDAISRGDVLYLAPTNALVHQIRRDLESALRDFKNVNVLAFVGNGEYTRLSEEDISSPTGRFVAVMTPEKSALALRLAPTVFSNCALCIFDECHLLNDEHRGVIADLLLAQLFIAAPKMHFILMSAMVGNPAELADWLRTARGSDARPSQINWRPSRTLRGLLVVDSQQTWPAFETARGELLSLLATKKNRKNVEFDAELALIAGLSGPWTRDQPLDYRSAALGLRVVAQASVPSRKLTNIFFDAEARSLAWPKGRLIVANFKSWKNAAACLFAERLALARIPTINFILTSRHHAFHCAEKVTGPIPGSLSAGAEFPTLVEAWLRLADAELGQASVLRDLLRRGIAVHTSAMLQVEQAAAEWMFSNRKAGLMFATGTLAQGLNLPAVGVVISGTSMGDPREAKDADNIAGIGYRADAMILNGFGRAGRPGFSNQGLAVLVSDKPITASMAAQWDASSALAHYPVLGKSDAAVIIQSPVENFLDRMFVAGNSFTAATEVDLELVTQLAESPMDGDHAGEVLKRTFAGYQRRQVFNNAMSIVVRDRIASLKQTFLQQPGIPPWLNRAAMEAGVDIVRAKLMWAAYTQRGQTTLDAAASFDMPTWLNVFIDVMSRLPPVRVASYMAEDGTKTVTVLTRLRDCAPSQKWVDTVPWDSPPEWAEIWGELLGLVRLWLDGATYKDIAKAFCKVEEIPPDRTSGKPLPTVFGLIQKLIEPLAKDAGCFVALVENSLKAGYGTDSVIPESLQSLPLCLRVGCGTLDSLAWFRFCYRQRAAAQVLAKAFPIPPSIVKDSDRARWVRETNRQWRNGLSVPLIQEPLLPYIKIVLQQANL